jgi:hypothetical protein
MARKQTFSAQTIIKIVIFGVLIGAIVWSVFGQKETNDIDQNYGTDLSPSTSVLQQQVIDTLNQKINSEAQINDNDLEVSGNQASMEIKLSALIRASTADIDPTDDQLVQFYYNHSNDYTSDARSPLTRLYPELKKCERKAIILISKLRLITHLGSALPVS